MNHWLLPVASTPISDGTGSCRYQRSASPLPLTSFSPPASPVSASIHATCCQLGWKSQPTINIEGSLPPQGLFFGPQPKTHQDRLRAFALIQSTQLSFGWVGTRLAYPAYRYLTSSRAS